MSAYEGGERRSRKSLVSRERGPEGASKLIASMKVIVATALFLAATSFGAGVTLGDYVEEIYTNAPAERARLRADVDSLAVQMREFRQGLDLLGQLNAAVYCSVTEDTESEGCETYSFGNRAQYLLRRLGAEGFR